MRNASLLTSVASSPHSQYVVGNLVTTVPACLRLHISYTNTKIIKNLKISAGCLSV